MEDASIRAEFFWPKALAVDFPDARILTYGYDSDITHFFKVANQNNITTHARGLLSAVQAERISCVSSKLCSS
jgi:hypothetical protein